jgi:hypothetical protein
VDACERVDGVGGAAHSLEHRGAGVLEGDIQVRQHLALGHQRNDGIDVRVGVDVVQPDPDAELAERARQIDEPGLDRLPAPGDAAILQVAAVGAGVLGDHQQFLHAAAHQRLGLFHHLVERPAGELAAQVRDDAEAALVVAALGDLQVRIVARREADPLRRQQVDVRIVRLGQVLVHRCQHGLVLVRAGDGEQLGVLRQDALGVGAEAAGDDDAAVLLHRLVDGLQGFVDRGFDEAAGVDHDEVGAGVVGRDVIAAQLELGDDAFGIDQCLGAAQADEADGGRVCARARLGRGHGVCNFRPGTLYYTAFPERCPAWPSTAPITSVSTSTHARR